uniref:Ig-like domain-containing protein n=1 Tax=Esox lucius TaxID=8010 RepID=A0A6Q2Y0E3_ESOLU
MASVSVSPHGLLYSGETVTLQCDIPDFTDWTYQWYNIKKLQSAGSPSKTITALSDQVNQYQCQGTRTDLPQSSQLSVSLHITVTANQPKATLSSDQKDILTGDNVTLTCTVESSGWRFYWYRHRQESEPVNTTSGSSYTLRQVNVSDGGQYRCRAGRGDPVYYTQYSEPVHIQVTGSICNRIFWPIHPQSTNQDPQQDQGSIHVQSPDAGYTSLLHGDLNIYHFIKSKL